MKKLIGIQGDIVIWQVDQPIPKTAKKRANGELVYGESTGHAHRLKDGVVYDYGDRLLLQTYQPTIIDHPEHDEIPLEMPGVYEITRQREYTGEEMTRLVID